MIFIHRIHKHVSNKINYSTHFNTIGLVKASSLVTSTNSWFEAGIIMAWNITNVVVR